MSRLREQDCDIFEQKLLEAEDPALLPGDPTLAAHLHHCESCKELYRDFLLIRGSLEAYQVREPSKDLLKRVHDQALRFPRASMETAATRTRSGLLRILAAGVVALPIVLLINTVMGWALYEIASSVLPRSVAQYCIGLFILWASLGVSLSYASLPFLSLIPGGGAFQRKTIPAGPQAPG